MSTRCTNSQFSSTCKPTCEKAVNVKLSAVNVAPNLVGFVGGKKGAPGLIVLQEWWGVNNAIKETAFYLGQQGYRVLIPDLYRGVIADNSSHAVMLQAKLNWTQAVADMNASVEYLYRTGSKRVAVTGFCQGGGLALCAAQFSRVVAAAPFYGAPSRTTSPCRVEAISKKVPVLYQWGDLDSAGNVANFKNATAMMRAAGVNVKQYSYTSSPHAFMNFLTPYARSFAIAGGRVPPPEAEIVLAFDRLTSFLATHLLGKK